MAKKLTLKRRAVKYWGRSGISAWLSGHAAGQRTANKRNDAKLAMARKEIDDLWRQLLDARGAAYTVGRLRASMHEARLPENRGGFARD